MMIRERAWEAAMIKRVIGAFVFVVAFVLSDTQSHAVIGVPSYCYPRAPCVYCIEKDSDGNCHKCQVRRSLSYCRHATISRSPPTSMTPEQLAILNAHNKYRDKHCVARLQWSGTLAASAAAWASKCQKDANGNFCHQNTCGTKTSYGENLSAGWRESNGQPVLPGRTADASVDAWYCEIAAYNYNAPAIVGGTTSGCTPVNGHFTQVVWKGTTQVGCAQATCSINSGSGPKQGTLWVCKYSPAGNINTPQQLTQNVTRVCK
jgi:uncharacterized protein YkwD